MLHNSNLDAIKTSKKINFQTVYLKFNLSKIIDCLQIITTFFLNNTIPYVVRYLKKYLFLYYRTDGNLSIENFEIFNLLRILFKIYYKIYYVAEFKSENQIAIRLSV